MKRNLLILAITVAFAAALAGGSMAWFTDSGTAGEAKFTSGTVDIEAGMAMAYGVEQDTGDLYGIDLSSGKEYLLFDEATSDSNEYFPNALAFDRENLRLYYAMEDGDLYFYCFESQSEVDAEGSLDDTAAGATFGKGAYWYILNGTDDLYKAKFGSDGKFEEKTKVADISGNKYKFNLGDLAIEVKDNVLYGSTTHSQDTMFFSYCLDSEEIKEYTDEDAALNLQLAFGADGILYGHSTADSEWFKVDISDGSKTETEWSSGDKRFTDLASNYQNNWNPGDCEYLIFHATNTGSKNVNLRINFQGHWENGQEDDNITFELCAAADDSKWKIEDNKIYYLEPLEKNKSVELGAFVCFDGEQSDDNYQGASYTLSPEFEAIQASNYAPYHEWGVAHYGVPQD